jgi:hypothetical protein
VTYQGASVGAGCPQRSILKIYKNLRIGAEIYQGVFSPELKFDGQTFLARDLIEKEVKRGC